MTNYLLDFYKNNIFWTAAAAWLIAQTIKVAIGVFKEKRLC